MSKHMPDVPPANRSTKGPGDHHDVASDTTPAKHPDELEHFPVCLNREALRGGDSRVGLIRQVSLDRLIRRGEMAKAYSQDLRERVILAVGRGASRRAAAAQFSISASSAIKWDQRFRETGSALAKSLKGKSRSPLEAYAAWLLALNAEEPDLTLEEIRGRIEQEHAITPAVSALWRFFDRHKISFKKNRSRQRAKAA